MENQTSLNQEKAQEHTWGLEKAGPLSETEKDQLENFYKRIISSLEDDKDMPEIVGSTVSDWLKDLKAGEKK